MSSYTASHYADHSTSIPSPPGSDEDEEEEGYGALPSTRDLYENTPWYEEPAGVTGPVDVLLRQDTQGDRVIALMDLSCFYVQVEEHHDPGLRGKPAGVLQRHCVASSNYIARARGVGKMARHSEALAVCPDMILVPSEMKRYHIASVEIFRYLETRVPLLEKYSIDEAFLDLTKLAQVRLQALKRGEYTEADGRILWPGVIWGVNEWSGKSRVHCVAAAVDTVGTQLDHPVVEDFYRNGTPIPEMAVQGVLPMSHLTYNKYTWVPHQPKPTTTTTTTTTSNGSSNSKGITGGVGMGLPPAGLEVDPDGRIYVHSIHNLSSSDALALAGAQVCQDMRRELWTELGYMLSCGLGPNKLVAKMCAGLHKPDNQTYARVQDLSSFMAAHDLRDVPGIGRDMVKKLEAGLSVRTCAQAQHIALQQLIECLGERRGKFVYASVRGQDPTPVLPKGPPKTISVMAGTHNLQTLQGCEKQVNDHCLEMESRLQIDLIENGYRRPKTLSLAMVTSYHTDPPQVLSTAFPAYSKPGQERAQAMYTACLPLLKRAYKRRVKYLVITLAVTNFTASTRVMRPDVAPGTSDLSQAANRGKKDRPMDAFVSTKHGPDVIWGESHLTKRVKRAVVNTLDMVWKTQATPSSTTTTTGGGGERSGSGSGSGSGNGKGQVSLSFSQAPTTSSVVTPKPTTTTTAATAATTAVTGTSNTANGSVKRTGEDLLFGRAADMKVRNPVRPRNKRPRSKQSTLLGFLKKT